MSEEKPDEAKDQVSELISKLGPQQQEDLRRRLNRVAWSRRFEQVYNIVEGDQKQADPTIRKSLGTKLAMAVQEFIDQLEAGELDQVLVQGIRQTWLQSLQTINSLPGTDAVESQSRQSLLEGSYDELQNQLIQVRQAVAQAIASEKQIENQLTKSRDQAATWQNRANQATQQGNEHLAQQARDRGKQYHDAAIDLESQVKIQRAATDTLRKMLTKIEGEVQKAYTKKHVLMARDKAATATLKAKEILSKFDSTGTAGELERMEQIVIAKEQEAGDFPDLKDYSGSMDIGELVARLNASIDRYNSVIEKIENQVVEKEKQAELPGAQSEKQTSD